MKRRRRKTLRPWRKAVDEWLEWYGYPHHGQIQSYEYWFNLWSEKKRAYDAARWGITKFEKGEKAS